MARQGPTPVLRRKAGCSLRAPEKRIAGVSFKKRNRREGHDMARSTLSDFEVLEQLGAGSFGVVWKVRRKVDNQVYAAKELNLTAMSRQEQEECFREARVLASLDHPNVIKYYDSFLEQGRLYIVMELAERGTLRDLINHERGPLSEDVVWRILIQVLLALKYIHERKILHRDIKSMNVFLDDKMTVKLGDLGVARVMSAQTDFARTLVGTPYYLSPEICEDKPYNSKSDVWALGVVLYECCTGKHPFDAENQGALILKILRGKYPPIKGYSTELSDLVKRCLTQAASRRPNTVRLLGLPFVARRARRYGLSIPEVPSTTNNQRPRSARSALASRPSSRPQSSNPSTSAYAAKGPKRSEAIKRMNSPAAAARRTPKVSEDGKRQHPKPFSPLARPSQANPKSRPSTANTPLKPQSAQPRSRLKSSPRVGETVFVPDLGLVGGQLGLKSRQDPAERRPSPAWGEDDHSRLGFGGQVALALLKPAGIQRRTSVSAPSSRPQSSRDAGSRRLEREVSQLNNDLAKGGHIIARHHPNQDDPWFRPRPVQHENPTEPLFHAGDTFHDEKGEAGQDGLPRPSQVTVLRQDSFRDRSDSSDDSIDSGQRCKELRSAHQMHKQKCKDIIGDQLFNELYSTLRSQTEKGHEMSISELSRLVYNIIPYDKTEAITCIYRMLYIESQLETNDSTSCRQD